MSSKVNSLANLADDKARYELCARLAEAMNAGAFRFQIRFLRSDDAFGDVWIYVYQSHEWKKLHDYSFPTELIPSLWNQIEMISTRKYSDGWACLRSEHPDRVDFKLMFRRKALEGHLTSHLESFLEGCLFHGHHDSGQDSRRRIRFQSR